MECRCSGSVRALLPLIGRREEMLKITQILLQSRKNNLILVGEPGVGKTGIVEGFAQLLAEGKLPNAFRENPADRACESAPFLATRR